MPSQPKPVVRTRASKSAGSTEERVARLEASHEGHEEVCLLRFQNIDAKLDSMNGRISDLNNDARKAIDDVAERNDANHAANLTSLGAINVAINSLRQDFIDGQGRQLGRAGTVDFLVKIVPILLMMLSVYYVSRK